AVPNSTLTAAIDALASGRDLGEEQTAGVLAEIMQGEASETQIAGFLIALRTKGETVEELTGLARTMRSLASPVRTERHDQLTTRPPASSFRSGASSPFARSSTSSAR